MDYWTLVEIPNCRLCRLIVKPGIQENDSWNEVLDAYREVWSKAGSKADRFAEIEHLQLISDALGLIDAPNAEKLRDKIVALITNLLQLI
jgi:hypothetical protein